MFVLRLRYPNPAATLPFQTAHSAWVTRNADAGYFLLSGPTNPRDGGVILVDVPSRAQLEAIVAEDPYQQAGTTYEIVEFDLVGWTLDKPLATRVPPVARER